MLSPLKKVFNALCPLFEPDSVDARAYFKNIESGKWKDKLVFGISQRKAGFLTSDPFQSPGAAYIGMMGSGKSVAMRFTLVTDMACNSAKTLYFLYDQAKAMGDYSAVFKYPNVITAVNVGEEEKFILLMDMLWSEICKRNKVIAEEMRLKNLQEYEEAKSNPRSKYYDPNFKGLARIKVYIEEFAAVSMSKLIGLEDKKDNEGSAAWQFKLAMRIGRSVGITFVLATQRATYTDIPNDVKQGLASWFVFKVGSAGDAASANLPAAADIPKGMPGRCVTEEGFMQYPYIDRNINALLDHYVKPLEAEFMTHQLSDYKKAFSQRGISGLLYVKPVVFAVKQQSQFKPADVGNRILSLFGFSCTKQENSSLVADLIAERDGEKYAVVLHRGGGRFNRGGNGDEVGKSQQGLIDSLPLLKVKKIISIGLDGDDPFESLVSKHGGYSVSQQELFRIADVIDNKETFEDKGDYDTLFSRLVLASKDIESSKSNDASEDEEFEEPNKLDLRSKFLSRSRNIKTF